MWIFLALTAAVSTAMRDVASKRAVRSMDPVPVALGVAAVPTVLLGGIVLATGPAAPGDGFWLALVVSGGINAVATPLIVVALQRSDLSLVTPLTSLTPLFMLVTGAVVLGEVPGPRGIAGVVTIVAGAWLLALPARHQGALGPFRAVLGDPGARAMLLVAFLYSISATYDKVGAQASSPLLWAASINGVVTVAMAAVMVAGVRTRRRAAAAPPVPWGAGPGCGGGGGDGGAAGDGRVVAMVLLAGLFAAIMAAAQMTAILLTLAAYVIAVKRTSTLFGVMLGHAVFHEQHVRERLVGAVVMLAGFVILTFDG